jgi:DNA-binding transcriptional LysR family regulator
LIFKGTHIGVFNVRLTLAQLEAFAWVARLGSVQEAARQLNLAQPTVSLRLRDLEVGLGTRLFTRAGRRLQLTHAGDALLVHSRTILDEIGRIRERLALDEEVVGTVRIGVPETFALVCLPSLLRAMRSTHPGLRIELVVATSFELEREVRGHHLDLAFLVDPSGDPGLRLVPLGVQETTWAASPAWGLGPTIRPTDLRHLPILTNPYPSAMYRQITDWFRGAGVEPVNLDICTSVTVIVQLVAAGVVVGFLPTKMIEAAIAEGRIATPASRPATGEARLYATFKRDDTSPAIEAVMLATREILAEVNFLRPL